MVDTITKLSAEEYQSIRHSKYMLRGPANRPLAEINA